MISFKFENGLAEIALFGHIDSQNAPEVEKDIFSHGELAEAAAVLIDAEELTYISSAGLRVILKLRRNCPDMRIIGASPEVYEVLEMTGFTEMIKVEKAYRRLSVEGCRVLGEGSNGIVYRYDPEIVVKVYRNKNALPEIKRERALARRALILGIPTAIPFDVVRVGDSFGSVFELLNAQTFSELIKAEPENEEKYIFEFVELLKKIHSTEVGRDEMTDAKAVALDWARFVAEHLPADEGAKLIALTEAVPERTTMIHGDYHTNNVELQNGEVLLIDMDTLSFGHPVFELASMFLGFVGFGETDPSSVERFMKLPYDKTKYIWGRALSLYLGTADKEKIEAVDQKAQIIGYTRLLRRTVRRIGYNDPSGAALIAHCKSRLSELLAKTDTLTF